MVQWSSSAYSFLTAYWALYNALLPNQWSYAWWTLVLIGLAALPFYSWAVLLFSIPILILDLIFFFSATSSSYFYYFMIALLYSIPAAFGMAVFGEVVLIPLALVSPITGMIGTIVWVYGDVLGYSVETYIIFIIYTFGYYFAN